MSAPTNGGPEPSVPSVRTIEPNGPIAIGPNGILTAHATLSERDGTSPRRAARSHERSDPHPDEASTLAALSAGRDALAARVDALLAQRDEARAEAAKKQRACDALKDALDAEVNKSVAARNESRSLAASLDAALAELRQRTSERDQARAILQRLADNKSGEPIVYANLRHEARAALGAERPA